MAIVETGNIFNSLIFGGVRSVDYGIYITGEAVYNVPVRAVEMVSVPGRNGAIAIDQGYWENIEVSYPAGCFGSTQAEFAEAIARFRNAIASQVGYKRLTDTYHPEEYRMAMYISGLEVEAVQSGKAGEFTLTFDAKPQRFLITGEERTTLTTSGATIPNPTLNEASPLIEVEGYGTLTVNDYEIEITNQTLGDVTLWGNASYAVGTGSTTAVNFNAELLATSDTITISWSESSVSLYLYPQGTTFASVTASNSLAGASNSVSVVASGRISIREELGTLSFAKGTSATKTDTLTVQAYDAGSNLVATAQVVIAVAYDGAGEFSYSVTYQVSSGNAEFPADKKARLSTGQGSGVSTVSMLGNPTYIDCDLGVCYKIENDTVIDLNSYIDLGSDLPVLSPGSNTVTFDNTITSVGFIPRWWIL